ncbi:MAG: acyltransferase [Armatimonadetes bacterium]|nr:acyltransferase [Armatimonadota bacterium]
MAAPREDAPRLRLEFLDGLRGLSALYVVLFHVWLIMNWQGFLRGHVDGDGLPGWLQAASSWMRYGAASVAVFIVLSGYCLMLPVVTTDGGKLRGGAWGFLKRRARRILPPYYASLALSLLLIALVPGLRTVSHTWWDHVLPAFSRGALISHLFLFHNLTSHWNLKINGVLWSVATEWQIYFLLPFLLLPVWRRFGLLALIGVSYVLGCLPHYVFHGQVDSASYWYIGLFGLGMAGVILGFSEDAVVTHWRRRFPWLPLAFVLCVAYGAVASWTFSFKHGLIKDTLIGLAVTSLLIRCTNALKEGPKASGLCVSLFLRLFECRAAKALGSFSYSLYLTHALVLGCLYLALRIHHASPMVSFFVLLLSGVPLSLGVAFLFHLAFERRFLSSPRPLQKSDRDNISLPASIGMAEVQGSMHVI